SHESARGQQGDALYRLFNSCIDSQTRSGARHSLSEEKGVGSLKIYMNLGANLNRIFMDLYPRTHGIREAEVDMTDDLLESIVQVGAKAHSTILVHAENPNVCSEGVTMGIKEGKTGLQAWSD